MSKIKISIPSPCHEKWQDMTPVERGRFCASCQKVVHDFTRSSDREIASVLANESNACGRFINTQLDRDLVIPKEKSTIWMAGSAAVISFLSLGTNEAIAQNPATEQLPYAEDNEIPGKVAPAPTYITGVVSDEQGMPIPGVVIYNTNIGIKIETDFDGRFSIEANKGNIIECTFLGFKDYNFKVKDNKFHNVQLESELNLEDMPIDIYGRPDLYRTTFFGRVFRTIGNWFRKEDVNVRYK